jgi:hypothetical protein
MDTSGLYRIVSGILRWILRHSARTPLRSEKGPKRQRVSSSCAGRLLTSSQPSAQSSDGLFFLPFTRNCHLTMQRQQKVALRLYNECSLLTSSPPSGGLFFLPSSPNCHLAMPLGPRHPRSIRRLDERRAAILSRQQRSRSTARLYAATRSHPSDNGAYVAETGEGREGVRCGSTPGGLTDASLSSRRPSHSDKALQDSDTH